MRRRRYAGSGMRGDVLGFEGGTGKAGSCLGPSPSSGWLSLAEGDGESGLTLGARRQRRLTQTQTGEGTTCNAFS